MYYVLQIGGIRIDQVNLYNANRRPGMAKQFIISEVNRPYYEMFLKRFPEASRRTYKVNVGQFLEALGPSDFAKIPPSKIKMYVRGKIPGQRRCAESHLRSMMMFIVQNDISGAANKVKKETLIWLLEKRTGGE